MKFNSYELSRDWFDFCFENPDKIKTNHTALYFFMIEHCNRLGWKEKFGLPTTMSMEAIGIKSYNTYINTFNDLVNFGAIKLIEKSKNQYSANIIALSKFNKAPIKALDKALIKHRRKQSESTSESNSSINKQGTNNKEQITIIYIQIFDHWKSCNLIKHRSLTKEMKNSIKLLLNEFTVSDIIQSISNYNEIYNSNKTFFNHNWTLEEFLSRKKGMRVFLYKSENDYLSKSDNKKQSIQFESLQQEATGEITFS